MRTHSDPQRGAPEFYDALKHLADRIEKRYRSLTPTSARLAESAQASLPGGCARQGVFRNPYPVYVDQAEGSTLTDADGRQLVDFCFNATALAVGHAHPRVVEAVSRQLTKGTAYFSPTKLEIELAQEIQRRLTSAERMIFLNTGGEAVMMALRLARAYTGRSLIAKFEGAFHGNYDDVLWSVRPECAQAGPQNAPAAIPASEGLLEASGRTLVLPYNASAETEHLVEAHASRLAAVILEPLANRMGLVVPTPEFIHRLRDTCTRRGILLIFDEVLSFRTGYRGMQARLDVRPDLTVLGKIIGGGFPVGAVVGREDVLAMADPRKPRVYHTGTFSANPITLTAGKATLDVLTPSIFDDLDAVGDRLRAGLREICHGLPLQVSGLGSLFKITATDDEVRSYRQMWTCDLGWQQIASLALMNAGMFVNSQLNGCIATTTTAAQVEAFLEAFSAIVSGRHERSSV